MEEMNYYKTVYDKFWVNQTKLYGYGPYERKLVNLIADCSPERVFEVGIGTGWPIGNALKEKGIKVDGCDVAQELVVLARKSLDNADGIWMGEVTEFHGDWQYDVVYCVRVSWYLPDFYEALEKMITMTKPGGYIVFDVMDKHNICCRNIRRQILTEKYYKLLGIQVDERFGTHFVSIFQLKRFLKKHRLFWQSWREVEITHSEDREHTPKVVFCCRKEQG